MVAVNLVRSPIVYHKSPFYDKVLELTKNTWNAMTIYQTKRAWVHSKTHEVESKMVSVKELMHTAHHTLSCVYMQSTEGGFPPQNILELLEVVKGDIPPKLYLEVLRWKEGRDFSSEGDDTVFPVTSDTQEMLQKLTPFHFLHGNERVEKEVMLFDKLLRATLC